MQRDHFNAQSLGSPLNRMVKEARILMVGAGGIGCELLKNLVLTGFGEVHIVDLDTIDLSNLNRQFLFRHEHIKKSKSLVAKEAAHAFNPNVKLEAHHANIKDPQFNVKWFKSFTMVFNALDNLEARRHVNKMCLAAGVPLIESGTTGFNGQVQVIKKGVTACYDCSPKETPKSFPVCTIRSTPSQPIHCIVWGKSYLLSEIFGASEDESTAMDHSEDSENAEEIEKLRQEAQALKKIKESMGSPNFLQLIFDKVFNDDIIRLRSMEEMWKTRRPPEAMSYASLSGKISEAEVKKENIMKDGQRVWTLEENVVVFKDSLERLSRRFEEMKLTSIGISTERMITFDKDDIDTLDFVTASSNLRSIVFGIEAKSRFDVKQMAGNIIPAIATTNAIVAGLCVLESFKVLRGDYPATKEVYLSPFTTERILSSDRFRPPHPDCPVCSTAQASILADMSRATLGNLVEDFLRSELGYSEEMVVNHGDSLLYDVEETDNLSKKLTELGIKSDSFLTVIDEDDDNPKGPRVNLIINVLESEEPLEDRPIRITETAQPAQSAPENETPPSPIARRKRTLSQTNGDSTHDTIVNPTTNGSSSTSNGTKRAFLEVDDGAPPKRSKIETNGGCKEDRTIVLDDTDGAIVIDD